MTPKNLQQRVRRLIRAQHGVIAYAVGRPDLTPDGMRSREAITAFDIAGVAVDGLHALTAMAVAALDRRRRRLATAYALRDGEFR